MINKTNNPVKRVVLTLALTVLWFSLTSQTYEKCGTWRWSVKTLTDKSGIDWLDQEPEETTIDELVKPKPPKKLATGSQADGKLPRYPEESQLVRFRAYVTEIKSEGDHDLHFVLQSAESDEMMVGEIPHPGCPEFDRAPKIRELITKSRKQGDEIKKELKKSENAVLVEITGVPFWDALHGATGAAKNGREIHPITSIELVDQSVAFAPTEKSESIIGRAKFMSAGLPQTEHPKKPLDVLIMVLLGAILGTVGQGLRVIVGLKKLAFNSNESTGSDKSGFQTSQLVISLFISFAIGAIAGVLAAVMVDGVTFTTSVVLSFITAGYAGTDFIEGFIKKNPPSTAPSANSAPLHPFEN